MKRQNLLAVLIFVVAVSGCAVLVGFGDADADAPALQPFLDFNGDDLH
jgi:hypothetical protein